MKELTFREVIANIKDGEIWEHRNFVIEIEDDGNHEIKIRHKKGFNDCSAIYFEPSDKFQLQRKKYSFAEAFKAYEEGKEIESCINSDWYYKLDECELLVCAKEIKGEWYIND